MNTHTTSTRRGFYINRSLAAVAATLLTAAWMAAAQPAYAGVSEPATTRVDHVGLNLNSDAGERHNG
ncbi:MAG: UrcA family protein [Gammaproteobacteria bacterium]|nr:UrcA family protein [Gammaproteobacteria bacterium]